MKAVRLAHKYMPNGYVEVDAQDFLREPEKYGWLLILMSTRMLLLI